MLRLGEIAKVTAGQAAPKNFGNDGYPFIRAGHLEELIGGKSLSDLPKVSQEVSKQHRLNLLPKNSIIFAKSGMSATKNRIYILKEEAYFVSHLAAILPNESIDMNYLSKYLFWYNPTNLILDEAYPSIRLEDINNLKIPLPPFPQQQKIANILDAADALRQNDKALIAKYDELTQALFLDMFGDPVSNPKGCKIVELGDICSKITDGVHAKPEYTETGVPFISVKDITTGVLKFEKCKYISEEAHIKYFKRCNPEYLDILYTKVGATYGRPAIVDVKDEFSLYVSVALIKPKKDIINPYFLKEVMGNPVIKRQADKSIKGIGVPDLHLNMIKKFLLPLPPMETQILFSERVGKIEEQRAIAQKSLEQSERLFNSLLQKAFKGEL